MFDNSINEISVNYSYIRVKDDELGLRCLPRMIVNMKIQTNSICQVYSIYFQMINTYILEIKRGPRTEPWGTSHYMCLIPERIL